MFLKKKIILSFLISSITILIFSVFFCINFVEIKKGIRNLELSESIRNKSLQLRRHEKNFFLYRDLKEVESVYNYIREIEAILKNERYSDSIERLQSLEDKVEEYRQSFNRIKVIVGEFQEEFNRLKPSYKQYYAFFPLVESTILERPIMNAELLRGIFSLQPGNPAIKSLQELNDEISALRRNGEEILNISEGMERIARGKVEKAIGFSQHAALILFPIFFVIGFGTLFAISHSIVNRLKILTGAIKKTAKGDFSSLPIPAGQDEIGGRTNNRF
ncbi:MAG: hypothetical protein HZA07_04060 [Nitrospirae bacterium]|nr:hypothetical protein [Nitrospirota bacterium]